MMSGQCWIISQVSFNLIYPLKDIKTYSLLDNIWPEIVKLSKVEEESQVSRTTQCEEDHFEMLVRAANIVSKFSRQTIKLRL